MTKIRYRVQSAAQVPMDIEEEIRGKLRSVQILGLEVELVSDDGSMCHKLRLIPDDMDEAVALFEDEGTVEATFTKISGAPTVSEPIQSPASNPQPDDDGEVKTMEDTIPSVSTPSSLTPSVPSSPTPAPQE